MLALRRGGRAIAVGVQTEELQTVHALGVELVQVLFGEPWAAERLLRPTAEKGRPLT
jgi:hypothetical protein